MKRTRPLLQLSGLVPAATFALQAVVLPAVHPCAADHSASVAPHGHHRTPVGPAAGGVRTAVSVAHHAMPGMGVPHGLSAAIPATTAAGAQASPEGDRGGWPPHHTGCTCVGCACCALPVAMSEHARTVAAVEAFRQPQPAVAVRDLSRTETDLVLPPAIGPPAHLAELT